MKNVTKFKIRKIFSVYIRNTEYNVYDIDGKEHEGYNNIPKTWWLYFGKEQKDWDTPPLISEDWTPFDVGIKRHLWEFEIKQNNTHKIKWDDNRFSNNISVDMICNKKKIYSFGTFDMNFALSKLQYLQVVLTEHPYNFLNQEEEKGRKIYYYGLPATIEPSYYPGEIKIIPEYSKKITEKKWWEELERREKPYIQKEVTEMDKQEIEMDKENREENRSCGYINWGDALSDGHINWFRK